MPLAAPQGGLQWGWESEMSAGTIGIEGALTALDEARGTLSLRTWMERHRAEVLRHCDGRRIDWVALCRWFTEVGLVNARGLAPTVKCAKMMWYRVGKWMAARQERASIRAEEKVRDAIRKEAELQALREKMAEADKGVAERQLEARRARATSVLFPDDPLPPQPTAPNTPARVSQSDAPVDQDAALQSRLGQVKPMVVMLKQAPRYGKDKEIPLPPPYVGPRPPGMPDNLPLEALMPLDASGLLPNGGFDLEQLPGLPRRSFFETKEAWYRNVFSMLDAIPRQNRSVPEKLLYTVCASVGRRAQ